MIPVSFGIEYECDLIDKSSSKEVIAKFNNLLHNGKLLDFSYGTNETTFRLPAFKTEVLRKVLEIFKQYYNFNTSTTHVHIDCSHGFLNKTSEKIQNLTKEEKNEYLIKIQNITKYEVQSNKFDITVDKKYNMITYRSNFKTLEYRCFPVTFDYDLFLWQLINVYNLHKEFVQVKTSFIKMTSSDIKKRKIKFEELCM